MTLSWREDVALVVTGIVPTCLMPVPVAPQLDEAGRVDSTDVRCAV